MTNFDKQIADQQVKWRKNNIDRGLVDDAKGHRQYIISTCDESLWDLFRQRFFGLNGKAIMYKYVAIGDNGPVIKRIS